MARLKRPLLRSAVAAADSEFYARHPGLVQDGGRVPIDPDDRQHVDEWTQLYLRHGGELEDESPGTPHEGGRLGGWVKSEGPNQYVKKKTGTPVTAPKSHLFYSTTPQFLVEANWPLRGYYVYMDTDPTEKVSFGKANPWWTDENGFPHLTDANGNPVKRVERLAFGWSKDTGDLFGTPMSFVMIYDTDRQRLERKRKRVEGQGSAANEKHRTKLEIWRTGRDTGYTFQLFVPRDEEVLDVKGCEDLMAECNQARKRVEAARQQIYDHIAKPAFNTVIYFHRAEINAWLDDDLSRRAHLLRLRPGLRRWDAECQNFDNDLKKLTAKYMDAVEAVYSILKDNGKMRLFGQIDLVDSLASEQGDQELWRHEFLCEAYGWFVGTKYADEILENYLKKLLGGLSTPWDRFRISCKCATCEAMTSETTVDDASRAAQLDHIGWKAKDLKLGTRTAQRLIDLMTKFSDSMGKALATSAKMAGDIQFYSFLFIYRTTGFAKAPRPIVAVYDRWIDFWGRYYDAAKKGSGTLAEWSSKMDTFYADVGVKEIVGMGGKDYLKGISNCAQLLGAAITFYDVFSKDPKQWNAKTAADLAKASTEVVAAVVGIADGFKGGGLKAYFLARGYDSAAATASAARIAHWTRVAGLVGGVAQVAGSFMTLEEAAEKGDAREYGWGAVQYTGASIAVAGLALDSTVAGSPAGIVLNIFGGCVYLVGGVGEFVTRPSAIETLLRNEYLWSEDPLWDPGQEEAYEAQQQRKAEQRRRAMEEIRKELREESIVGPGMKL